MALQSTTERIPAAASTSRSIATRAAFSGRGSTGVASSKTRSDGSPIARSATMLLPLECIKGLPEPDIAAIKASTAPRWSLEAALITASAARASVCNTAVSSSEPTTASTPYAATSSAFALLRTKPRTLWPAAISARATAPPINPFAPVRKIRIFHSDRGLAQIIRDFVARKNDVSADDLKEWHEEFERLSEARRYFFTSNRYIFKASKPAL